MSVDDTAEQIAKLILETDTSYRGDLLFKVGEILRKNAQGFTGSLIRKAGIKYGLSKPSTKR